MSINAIDTNEEKLRKQQEMAGVQGVNPFGPAQGAQPVAPVNPLENKDIFTAAKEGMGQQASQPSGAPIDVMAIMGFERTTSAQPVTKPEEAGKTPEINGTLNAQKPQTSEVKNDEEKAKIEGKDTKVEPKIGAVKDIAIDNKVNSEIKLAPTNIASNAGSKDNQGQKVANNTVTAGMASVATPIADKAAPQQKPEATKSSTGSENSSTGVNPANASDINPSNVNTENSLQDQTQKLLKFGRPANAK